MQTDVSCIGYGMMKLLCASNNYALFEAFEINEQMIKLIVYIKH